MSPDEITKIREAGTQLLYMARSFIGRDPTAEAIPFIMLRTANEIDRLSKVEDQLATANFSLKIAIAEADSLRQELTICRDQLDRERQRMAEVISEHASRHPRCVNLDED